MKTFRLALTIIIAAAANVAILPADRHLAASGLFLDLMVIPLVHLQVSILAIAAARYITRKSCPQS